MKKGDARWRLNVLGGFSATANGVAFHSKSPYVARLLTMLAVRRGEPVKRSVVAANLIDDEQTADPMGTVRTLISRLNAAADKVQPGLLALSGDGIALGPDVESDVDEFMTCVEAAHRVDSAHERSLTFEAALSLWKGTVAPELDEPWLIPIRRNLESNLQSAFVELAASAISIQAPDRALQFAGLFDASAASSGTLTRALMELYLAAGNREAAVDRFENYDNWLYEHLGIGPAPEFEELLNKACRADARTRSRRRSAARAKFAPPPADFELVGRHKELLAAREWASSAPSGALLTLCGLSGIGKSQVLRALYWELSPSLQCIYIDCEASALAALKEVEPSDLGPIVLLDHASENRPLAERFLQHGCTVVATGPQRFGLPKETDLLLEPLATTRFGVGKTESESLFESAWRRSSLLRAESRLAPDALRLATELCGGVPLALELAAGVAASLGLDACVEELQRGLAAVGRLPATTERHASIGAAVLASLAALSPTSAEGFRRWAHYPGPIHVSVIEALCPGLRAVEIDQLSRAGLVRSSGTPGMFEALPIAASVVRELEDSSETRVDRSRAVAFASWLEGPTSLDVRRGASIPLAIAMIGDAACPEDTALRLIAALQPYVSSVRIWPEWIDACMERVASSNETGDRLLVAALAVGAMLFHAGDYDRMAALLDSGRVTLALESAGIAARLRLKNNRALAFRACGDLDRAEAEYRRAIVLAEAEGQSSRAGSAQFNLACVLEASGRFAEAAQAYEAAQGLLDGNRDPRVGILSIEGRARMLHLLGGSDDQALMLYRIALDRALELGDQRIVSPILQNLGALQADAGRFEQAVLSSVAGTAMLLAIGWTEEIRRKTVSSLSSIGLAVLQLGHSDTAKEVARSLSSTDATELWPVARRHCLDLRRALGLDGSPFASVPFSRAEYESLLEACATAVHQNLESARQREYAEWIARIA